MKTTKALVTLMALSLWIPLESKAIQLGLESYHLGTPGFPEWSHFEGRTPHGRQLDVEFEAEASTTEQSLLLTQDDVKHNWSVRINGKEIGQLTNREVALTRCFAIPAGLLKDGTNLLSIVPPKNTDDILISNIRLETSPRAETLSRGKVQVKVLSGGLALPCRITIVDDAGVLVPFHTDATQTLPTGRGPLPSKPGQFMATRPGVIYTRIGHAEFGLSEGTYTLFASRGFEWGVDQTQIEVRKGSTTQIDFTIEREVDTEGWIAADTHIHNLTHSGHGDATIDEGMITIAAEGIELAVATDHNHHTDYSPAMQRTGLQSHFTAVTGNEVTTKHGHFNAFPIDPTSALPDHKLSDWHELMRNIRSTTGAKVIQLNHPRNVHSGFSPMDPEHFRQMTGDNLKGDDYTFDAIEVVTSAALQSELMDPIRDWFGLLNRGYRITGLGSSDTHYVSRMILGQGRTYIACEDNRPEAVSIEEAVKSFRSGRALVSMGLLVNMTIETEGVGSLVSVDEGKVMADIRIQGPSWVSADTLELYLNGELIHQATLQSQTGAPLRIHRKVALPRMKQDAWLVAIATGPGVSQPFWPIPRPYQPTSKTWTPRIIGLTNPIRIDADYDGRWGSPYDLAKAVLASDKMDEALRSINRAAALQLASILHAQGKDLTTWLEESSPVSPTVRKAFTDFQQSLPVKPPAASQSQP